MGMVPVNVGQVIKTHISSINSHGQGVAKVDGYVVFVDDALPGEDCTIKIVKTQSKFSIAKLIKRDNDSKLRTKPRCKYFSKCGGCQLQHVKYHGQLLIKQKNIIDATNKAGLNIKEKIEPVVGMEKPWHYRNKVVFNVKKDGDQGVVGLFQGGSHRVVPVEHCYIINEEMNVLLPTVRAHLKYLYAKDEFFDLPFDRVFGRVGINNQMMAGFISRNDVHPQVDSLIVKLRRAHNDIVSIFHNKTYDDGGNLSRDNTYLWGMHHIDGKIGDLKLEISPNSFFQVNTEQTVKLYEIVKEFCNLTGHENVFDVYCGVGTIGMYVAKQAKKVYGLESVMDSVENAQKNARSNNIRNIEFLAGECEKTFPQLISSNIKPDVIIIDPPRKGCSREFMNMLLKAKADRIVYVSCNPATMARDVKFMTGKGYEVKKVQPVDMFPHTTHVECVVGLVRKD